MHLKDLDFPFPEELIATEPRWPSRIMLVQNQVPREISKSELLDIFQPGDVLVINDTKVMKRRIFSEDDMEILFLRQPSARQWEVLFPASRMKNEAELTLPEGIRMRLVARGRPQLVELHREIDETYFERHGELPLPPYIQKARGERHNRATDQTSYQSAWAHRSGSFAAPTASLHFSSQDLMDLRARGVQVSSLTLHVGLGTFLPVQTDDLSEHVMHEEWVEIPQATWDAAQFARQQGRTVWALGTTAVRALESIPYGQLQTHAGGFSGFTKLLIQDKNDFKVVSGLLTNFHQPKTTLLALVAAFAGLENLRRAYSWAIENRFRLFSYGDLSVWGPHA